MCNSAPVLRERSVAILAAFAASVDPSVASTIFLILIALWFAISVVSIVACSSILSWLETHNLATRRVAGRPNIQQSDLPGLGLQVGVGPVRRKHRDKRVVLFAFDRPPRELGLETDLLQQSQPRRAREQALAVDVVDDAHAPIGFKQQERVVHG